MNKLEFRTVIQSSLSPTIEATEEADSFPSSNRKLRRLISSATQAYMEIAPLLKIILLPKVLNSTTRLIAYSKVGKLKKNNGKEQLCTSFRQKAK